MLLKGAACLLGNDSLVMLKRASVLSHSLIDIFATFDVIKGIDNLIDHGVHMCKDSSLARNEFLNYLF